MRLIAPSAELDCLATGKEMHEHPQRWASVRDGGVVAECLQLLGEPHALVGPMNPGRIPRHVADAPPRRAVAAGLCSRRALVHGPTRALRLRQWSWTWEPTLDDEHLKSEVESSVNLSATSQGLRPKDGTAPAQIEYRVQSPHPLVTGLVRLVFRKHHPPRSLSAPMAADVDDDP